jgi:hypothetical protein
MRPYRLSKESKFWVKSGSEVVPVSRKAFVEALKKQIKLTEKKK